MSAGAGAGDDGTGQLPGVLAAGGPDPDDDPAVERHKLTALEGLAALSLDALSSVAYGPEAIVIVLMTAGAAALDYTLPVTIAIVVLLPVLVISYRQVIEAFPSGGGAYAVAKAHLGTTPSLVAAGSLVVDYILNAAVGRVGRRGGAGLGVPVPVRRPGADLPGHPGRDHGRQPVGRRRVGPAADRPDRDLHRRHLRGHHRRAAALAPGRPR